MANEPLPLVITPVPETKHLGQRILLVDDQRILNFLRLKLRVSGYAVITATTGEQAVGLFKSVKPDIIVMDVFMPGVSGLEFLKALRFFYDIPIIVISASTDDAEKAMSLGAISFMPKPLNPHELVKTVENCLDRVR
jgi:DNA-binding response OmpR family regulator